MENSRILIKKLEEINYLKGLLVARSEVSQEVIVDKIKYVMDDISLILSDLKYIERGEDANNQRTFTLNELSQYDGRNESLAYVAINGTVYDVTGVKNWNNGMHMGVSAGKDLTEAYASCHGNNQNLLNDLRIVGVLINR